MVLCKPLFFIASWFPKRNTTHYELNNFLCSWYTELSQFFLSDGDCVKIVNLCDLRLVGVILVCLSNARSDLSGCTCRRLVLRGSTFHPKVCKRDGKSGSSAGGRLFWQYLIWPRYLKQTCFMTFWQEICQHMEEFVQKYIYIIMQRKVVAQLLHSAFFFLLLSLSYLL